jgi:formate hydrogenlyase transcriptional activator
VADYEPVTYPTGDQAERRFERIIGNSAALESVLDQIGRFEIADKCTLFLDEVGDIPSALQPKLLRVLQEQEFERLGSGRTHKVDVRLVAATNRDLVKMVARGQFRSDLCYRLNVFPILLPALRERREDIPALVTHFVKLFSRRMGKQVDSIPPETMSAFEWHSWPGNIRELQNLMERAVSLCRDGVLPNPLFQRRTRPISLNIHRTQAGQLSCSGKCRSAYWTQRPVAFSFA